MYFRSTYNATVVSKLQYNVIIACLEFRGFPLFTSSILKHAAHVKQTKTNAAINVSCSILFYMLGRLTS